MVRVLRLLLRPLRTLARLQPLLRLCSNLPSTSQLGTRILSLLRWPGVRATLGGCVAASTEFGDAVLPGASVDAGGAKAGIESPEKAAGGAPPPGLTLDEGTSPSGEDSAAGVAGGQAEGASGEGKPAVTLISENPRRSGLALRRQPLSVRSAVKKSCLLGSKSWRMPASVNCSMANLHLKRRYPRDCSHLFRTSLRSLREPVSSESFFPRSLLGPLTISRNAPRW